MCVCGDTDSEEQGFWACDEEGSCGRGNLYHYEHTCNERSGAADDDHDSDPTPTSYNDGEEMEGESYWMCQGCGSDHIQPYWHTPNEPYLDCCRESGVDEDGDELPSDEIAEMRCEAEWVWLSREDDNSWANVHHLRATDFEFPEEVGKLYERRSITRLLVKGERALEIVEWMAHSAVRVVPLTDEELSLYAPTPEPEKEDAQCQLTV